MPNGTGGAARNLPGFAPDDDNRRRLRVALGVIGAIVAGGTVGYMLVEGWSLSDSLYMVIITLSTVGYGEVRPLTASGRTLTSILILTGVSAFLYVAALFARLTIEGELRRVVGRRRMDREIARLRDHYIVCGYGRVGREVCRNLLADQVSVIVVDVDAETLLELPDAQVPYVHGNAVEESVLLAAGVRHARGLLLTLSDEADNVYVTLTARELCPELPIIARSVTEQGERRLMAAGAHRVVSPERIGARSMSNSVTRPSTVDFTEIVTAHESIELQLEEQRISEESVFVGKSIEETQLRRNFGLIVVGIVTAEGEMVFNPAPAYRLAAGSKLIMLGERDDVRRFALAT